MRYVIELSQKQAEAISSFIKNGRYKNFQQFVEVAIENQINIESTDILNEPVLKNQHYSLIIKENDQKGSSHLEIGLSPNLSDIKNDPKTLPIPQFTDLGYSARDNDNLDEAKTWLWGQVNRIFPSKFALRILFLMLADKDMVELETFKDRAGDAAYEFGRMIRSYEKDAKIPREEKVSVGFPISSESFRSELILKMQKDKKLDKLSSHLKQEEFKSKYRYTTQFLASTRKDGRLEGALPYLRFVNVIKAKNGESMVGLTEPGLVFAKLANPIIDNKDFSKSLGKDEINFYLDHISKSVKGEKNAMKWLLEKLVNGISKIEAINCELRREFGKIWDASDAIMNTQRAGLMARMIEMGLISREKSGVGAEVLYRLTDFGESFLGRT